MFILQLIRKFYTTFAFTTWSCFCYNIGMEKGYKSQINSSENLSQVQEYIALIHRFFTVDSINYINELTHFNISIISFLLHCVYLLLFLIFMYLLFSIYIFIANFIDKIFLYKKNYNICKKCGSDLNQERDNAIKREIITAENKNGYIVKKKSVRK